MASYPELYQILVCLGWLFVLFVFWMILRQIFRDLGHEAPNVFKLLMEEFRSLVNFEWNVGSINALAILVTFLIGVVTLAALEMEKVLKFAAQLISPKKLEILLGSSQIVVIFLTVAVIAMVSVIAVYKISKIRC